MSFSLSSSWLRPVAGGIAAAVLWGGAGLLLRAQAAPTLGELAQKEQERRKTLKASGKVYSNRDLPKTPEAAQPAGPPPPAAPPPPGPATVKTVPADPAAKRSGPDGDEKNEAWWRGRMMQAQEAQRRGEAFAEALQSRINALSADAVNRDDPYQRAKAAEDRQKAIAELGRVTREIDEAKKEIASIEEEARQAGAPPGWIR